MKIQSLDFLSDEELEILDVALIRLADSDQKYWNSSPLWRLVGKVFDARVEMEERS